MIIFTDSFTVGASVDIASYPGTPDYSYLLGSAGDLEVDATDDRVEVLAIAADRIARLLNAACPTGDQQITLTSHTAGADRHGYIAARCAAASADCYVGQMLLNQGNEVEIFRYTSGFTSLVNADRGFTDVAGDHTFRLKAVGTTPVDLEFQVDATAVVTFADSDATRKQSGRPGIGGFVTTAREGWVDDVAVDNLLSGISSRAWTRKHGIPVQQRF